VNSLRAHVQVPDSGSVSRDCRAFLRAFIANLADPTLRSAIASLVGAAGRDPEFARAFQQRLVTPRRHELVRLLEGAQQRGELRPDADSDLLADLLVGPLFHRLLVTGEPIIPDLADELVDLVLEPQLLATTR
jgi:Tetracyclin repressor-like, C-terminal domain